MKTNFIIFLLLSFIFPVYGQTFLWNFHTTLEGWTFDNHVSGEVSEGVLHLNITGNDPYIGSPAYLNIPARDYKYFIIRMQNSTAGTGADLFWTNANGLHFTSVSVKANQDSMQYYIVDLSKNPEWSGTIHSMRLDPPGSSGSVHIDFIKLAGTYEVSDIELPILLEAENYNRGGEGNAYHDKTSGNEGGQYRPAGDVDIETTDDVAGNFHVSMESGEWMEYIIKVPRAYNYFFDLRVAATGDGNQVHLELNGQSIGEAYSFDNTGGSWITIRQEIELGQGVYTLRMLADQCPGELKINHLSISPWIAPVSFSEPGEMGSYRPGADVRLVVTVTEDIAEQVNKIEFYQNGQKIGEDESAPYEHNILSIDTGYFKILAIASDASGTLLDSAVTELFSGNSKVGIRPLPRGTEKDIDRDLWPNNPGGFFTDYTGQYPFVASHMDVITPNDFNCNFKGDFYTRQAFFEHYLPFDRDWIDTNPDTNPLVQKIRQVEKYGFEVKHILICREAELYGSGKWGPFPEDSRILYQKDVDDFRKVFMDAFAAGIIKHDNYNLIQMCISPTFYHTNPEAQKIIKTMDGVCLESHQYNVHWPLEQGIEKDLHSTAKGIRWTLANKLDYVFYYGPWLSQNCSQYYDDVVRDWLIKYWEAGMPKHHDHMHFYLNNFPHDCGAKTPVGPETDPHSTTGFAKWLIEEVGNQEPYPIPDPDDEETPEQKPFHGSPISIPGTVQVEDFDTGGEGVAYLDKSSTNEGGAYRTDEGVDIHEGGSGYVTGWSASGEWLEYTVNVENTGYYLINIQYFTLLENQKIQLSVDENNVTDIITFPFSDGNIANHEERIYLFSGVQVLRIFIVNATGGLDLDFIEFSSLVSDENTITVKDAFSIYPNPAKEWLNVHIYDSYQKQEETIKIVITDLQGRTVKSEFFTMNQLAPMVKEIDIRSLKPGVYIVSVITPEKLLINRFLKK